MKAAIDDFHEAIEELKETSPQLILEKAKEAYNWCVWNKNRPAHRQSKGCPSYRIAKLKNKNVKFKDSILHRDGSITLITTDNYYLKFYNRDAGRDKSNE